MISVSELSDCKSEYLSAMFSKVLHPWILSGKDFHILKKKFWPNFDIQQSSLVELLITLIQDYKVLQTVQKTVVQDCK